MVFENDVLGSIQGFIDNHGEPWFVANQICHCLNLQNSSVVLNKIIKFHLKHGEHIKGVSIKYHLLKTNGGEQKVAVVSESILYEMIFRSEKDEAFKFQQWVFKEVLPALRKHGVYRMEGKLIRKQLTDELQDSGENERMHGHAYPTYTKMIYKSLGLPNKVNRDTLSIEMKEKLAKREDLVRSFIAEGKQYLEIKAIIESNFKALAA